MGAGKVPAPRKGDPTEMVAPLATAILASKALRLTTDATPAHIQRMYAGELGDMLAALKEHGMSKGMIAAWMMMMALFGFDNQPDCEAYFGRPFSDDEEGFTALLQAMKDKLETLADAKDPKRESHE